MNNLKYRAFPEFYREYAPKLIEFFGGWIDWLNEEGNAGYIVDHLSTEHDIDESVSAYATHLKYKLLVDFPDFLASDFRLLLKNIFYLYNSKSSIQSYEFLFRCLFNSPAIITYPKEFILKASDGRWSFPYYLQTEGYDILMHLDVYNWFKLEGKTTHAIGYIDGTDVFKAESGEYESCLRVTSVTGTFEKGEDLELTNPETGEIVDIGEFKVKQYLMDYTDGRWTDTKGLLDSEMVIQDSYYYQDFSYIIRSNVPMNKWRALVKSLIHPAGLEFFGELALVDEDDGISPRIMATTPYSFISSWHLILKLYCLAEQPALLSSTWRIADFRMAQLQSETLDNWIYYGRYKKKDGFWNMNVGFSNKHANRSSVIMFRDDGTLIDPEIIKWGVMEFKTDINTRLLRATTLHPDKTIAFGTITGNEWSPEYEESFIPERAMIFITQTHDDSSYLIRDMILRDDYKSDNDGTISDKTIQKTNLTDIAVIPVDEREEWKKLTIRDFVTVSLEKKEFFDEYSYLKIPENYIEIENGYYRFPKRHYYEEKILVFSYGEDDIKERFFFENINQDKQHIFSMSSSTTKDYILCFADGKYTDNFTVNGLDIVVEISDSKYVEVYVLAPIEASRKLTEKYAGDRHFVYNNVRKWPYMVYNTHITKFVIVDYPENGYQLVDDAAGWKLQWVNTIAFPQALQSSSHLQISGAAQNHSETLDEWIARGEYYKKENVHDRIVSSIDKISNAHSTLVFSENGSLISPENIDWFKKCIISNDEENQQQYGRFLYSLPIMAESPYIHFTLDNDNTWSISDRGYTDNDFINNDYLVFANNVKIPENQVTANTTTKTYTFSKAITGDVYIFHPCSYYKQSYYYAGKGTKTVKISEKEFLDVRRIVVFKDGLLYHSWKYNIGYVTLDVAASQYVEIYILTPYSYFFGDITHFNQEHSYFTFDNLRKMNYMTSTSWLKKYTELEKSLTELEKIINMTLVTHAIIENKIALYKSSMNLLSDDVPETIPLYDTFDRLLYDGTYDIINFENMPVYFLEKELNKFSTMLFDSDGALINPNNITWSLVRFNTPTFTKTVTPVVLNGSYPATIGEVVTNQYSAIQIKEASSQNETLLDADNMETVGELAASNKILQDINIMSLDSISNLSAKNYFYYKDKEIENIPHFIPQQDEFFDENQLIFINGMKVYHDDWYIRDNVYYFNNIEKYDRPVLHGIQIAKLTDTYDVITDNYNVKTINTLSDTDLVIDENFLFVPINTLTDQDYLYVKYVPHNQEIVMFQYSSDDIEQYIYMTNTKNRFIELSRVGFLPKNLLVFKNGFLTSDYYISSNLLVFNTLKTSDYIEIYAFREYDYLFVNKNKYNNHYREFIITNIKRSRYF